MDGVVVAEQIAAIDTEIKRLHARAANGDDELAALIARAQIDELLEQRHKLTTSGSPRKRGADSSRF